jgi:hypothetical protein
MNGILVAVAGAAVLLGGALGVSYAQTAPAPTRIQSGAQHRQAVISDAASMLGLSADQLQQALTSARKDLGGRSSPLAHARREELQDAADVIGLPNLQALRTELEGTTLTAVAQNHNVQPSTVSAAIQTDLSAKIQAAVAAGQITAARGARLNQRAATRINALMTHQFPARKAA